MSFTDLFVGRPVLATVISLLILLVGARSLDLLELLADAHRVVELFLCLVAHLLRDRDDPPQRRHGQPDDAADQAHASTSAKS